MSILDNADDKTRKSYPVLTGVLDYFPDALLAVAEVSRLGNEQHNPGQPLHWAKEKSTDHGNTAVRHIMQRGTRDSDGGRHTAKAAWRILAMLQTEIETEQRIEKAQMELARLGQEMDAGGAPVTERFKRVRALPWFPRCDKPGGFILDADPRTGPKTRRTHDDDAARNKRWASRPPGVVFRDLNSRGRRADD